MKELLKKTSFWRELVQWGFFAWILYIGIRFGMFVRHFESNGVTPYITRPSGVDGFLPIGGLASLKLWLFTGTFDDKHPAALVLLVTFLLMSLIAKKSFCSWLCPVGTLSEATWKLGKRIFGRTFTMWRWLDIPLRSLKYLLLAFFVKILLIDMPAYAIASFIQSPYWSLSDVKMLRFFTHVSTTTMVIVGITSILSLFYKNFWCRYLCPYGALLGLVSMLSPFKIRRDTSTCTNCQLCTKACPAQLTVHNATAICNVECCGCLSCVEVCPQRSLSMSTGLERKPLPRWVFPVLLLSIYAGGVIIGMVSGHWDSSLTYEDYQRLVPMVDHLTH
ncbi:MAG: 4Fe-4S binding protein [Desulfuromonas sp.]|nr:4Fe-4S binding protein [Desulfuromonas sp.]